MIKVEEYRGKIRLVIPSKYYPKRYFYLNLPSQSEFYPIAHQIKRLIELDIATNSFDDSLAKYVPQSSDSIITVWEQYVVFKSRFLQPSSMRNLTTVTNHLNRIPHDVLINPPSLKLWLTANLSPEQSRRTLTQIKAAAKWGVEMGFLSRNPYNAIKGLRRIKRLSIDPFSPHERQLIINGFEQSEYYDYYTNFVKFLMLTGCRPSEAVALRWQNVSNNYIIFKEAIVEGNYKKSTKTYIDRRFPINQQLKNLLSSVIKCSKRVFNAKCGGVINFNNFNRRAWHRVLDEVHVRYRTPYNCRHTFITEMLKKGVDVQTVAGWVGNSPEIIYRHYAGVSDEEVPII